MLKYLAAESRRGQFHQARHYHNIRPLPIGQTHIPANANHLIVAPK